MEIFGKIVVTIESTEQKGPFSFDVYCDDSGSVNVVLSIDNSFLVDYVQVDIHIYDIEDKEPIFSGHAAIGKEVIEISDLLPGTQYKIDANTTKDVNTTVFTGIFCIISKDDVLSIEYQLTEQAYKIAACSDATVDQLQAAAEIIATNQDVHFLVRMMEMTSFMKWRRPCYHLQKLPESDMKGNRIIPEARLI